MPKPEQNVEEIRYTFYYFVHPKYQLSRKAPDFYTDTRIRIVSECLIFRSTFKIVKPLKKLFSWLINLHVSLQQYYEENLCYLIPCHGIEIVFTPDRKEESSY
ncbi:MAG: hypothetical protein JSW66_01350 [Phycisphaerales bacterium]|nr:MAG: hypothetical protein JSW66_01350 [Phycisphaerales bacterium]